MTEVSVIMPVYNAGAALRQAVASILAQTLVDFELVIVDDGSSDSAVDDVDAFGDERVRVFRNPSNRGAGSSRNRAIELARGRFLAIADADDIALPERLALQSRFLHDHPEIDLVAGATRVFGDFGRAALLSMPPTTPPVLELGLRYGPSFYHGTVMVRREAVRAVGGYADLRAGQDYDLYARLLEAGYRFGAITDVVLLYRNHDRGISKLNKEESRRVLAVTRARLQRTVNVPPVGALIRAARSEPVCRNGEPRLRVLKLLCRTAFERACHGDVRGTVYTSIAAVCVPPNTWFRLAWWTLSKRVSDRCVGCYNGAPSRSHPR